MKKSVKKLLAIFILIFFYIIINLICGNKAFAVNQTTSTDINSINSNQYPQIKEMLQSLQKEHPNWKFKILYTDINWADAISNEYIGHGSSPRNLVPANNINYGAEWICSICGTEKTYDSGKWNCASSSAIAYVMDPRNSINNTNIFQFLELSYSECSRDSIKAMVANTFLKSDSCINAIMESAKKYNVNPYYIVARILQEQSKDGSTLSKGQGYNGQYVGVYNVFNIGASGSGKENVILNGLKRAQSEGWTTLESSIIGGTQIIAKSYIARGQNTLYLQKFDVDNSDGQLYWHQYMQNLVAAQSEGKTLRKTFEDMGSINGAYTFIIPVFKNMTQTATPKPSTPNIDIPTGTDLVRVNVTGSLYLRDKPKKDANKIGSVYKDDIITRLEKATQKVDGTYWDYVITANGTKGYAARETYEGESTYKLYLVPLNNEPEDPTTTIKNSKVKINTQTDEVTTVPGATVKDFADLLKIEVVAKNAKGEVLPANAKLATGCVINNTYTVVVLGDVNGDGATTALDAAMILRYTVGQYNLTSIFKQAGNMSNAGAPTALDAAKILRYTVGQFNINIQ